MSMVAAGNNRLAWRNGISDLTGVTNRRSDLLAVDRFESCLVKKSGEEEGRSSNGL